MSRITIERPYEWANQQRNTYVYIDGERVGQVGIDQTAQFDVTPGNHTVVLKQKWLSGGSSKPLKVDLSNKEEITIKMTSYKYNWLIFTILFPLITSAYLILTNINSFMVKLVGVLLVFGLICLQIYMLYLRTWFIKIEEVEAVSSKKITKEEQARLISKIMEADERDGLYEA